MVAIPSKPCVHVRLRLLQLALRLSTGTTLVIAGKGSSESPTSKRSNHAAGAPWKHERWLASIAERIVTRIMTRNHTAEKRAQKRISTIRPLQMVAAQPSSPGKKCGRVSHRRGVRWVLCEVWGLPSSHHVASGCKRYLVIHTLPSRLVDLSRLPSVRVGRCTQVHWKHGRKAWASAVRLLRGTWRTQRRDLVRATCRSCDCKAGG